MKRMIRRICAGICSVYFLILPVLAAEELIPVGEVIGLEISGGTVTVAAYDDSLPVARDAGLLIGDEILAIDGEPVTCAADVRRALNASDGAVDLRIRRKGQETTLHLEPAVSCDGPKIGVYLRQGITGIGTITFYDPDTGLFGTLGHGVNNADGTLTPLVRGRAYPAEVVSIQKGKSGAPGQLKGALDANHLTGTLSRNTPHGVFGTAPGAWQGQALPVSSWEDLQTGDAFIRCAVVGNTPREYSVEILKIYPKNRADGRNLLLRVTDPDLLAATGGIVQGMGVSYNRDNTGTLKACKG